MSVVLATLGWLSFGIAIILGLLLDIVGLFGNWIILGAVTLAWILSGWQHFGWGSILIMAILAGLGELLEFVLAGYGAKHFGGSKGGMTSAVVGCILGAMAGTPLLPFIGSLLGACLGAFVGAALYEYLQQERSPGQAIWTGVGASLGKIGGLLAKLLCGLLMLLVAALTFHYGQ